jgi:hypothetical protein
MALESTHADVYVLDVRPVPDAPADLVELGARYWTLVGFDAESGLAIWAESTRDLGFEAWASKVGVAAAAGVVASVVGQSCPECGGALTLTSREAFRKLLTGQEVRCRGCSPQLEAQATKILEPANLQRRAAATKRAEVAQRDTATREQLVVDRQEAVRSSYPLRADADMILPSRASIDVRVATLAMLSNSDAYDPIPSLDSSELLLAPRPRTTADLVGDIISAGLLQQHPSTPTDAFVWAEDESGTPTAIFGGSYYPTRLRLYAPFDDNLLENVRECLDLQMLSDTEQHQLLLLAERLIAEEAFRYFDHQLDKYRLPEVADPHRERLKDMLERGARHFCLGHLYSMAWSAASAATNQAQRVPQMAKQNVTTYGVNSLEKKLQFFIDHPDELLAPYDILDDLPLSAMTRTLFYTVIEADPRTASVPMLREKLPQTYEAFLRTRCSTDVPDAVESVEWLKRNPAFWTPALFRASLVEIEETTFDACTTVCAHTQLRAETARVARVYDRLASRIASEDAAIAVIESIQLLNRARPEYNGEDRIGDLLLQLVVASLS